MIEVGDIFHNPREERPYRVIRIACPVHGDLRSCEANVEPDPERPDSGLMFTRCASCNREAKLFLQRLSAEEAARVVRGGTKPEGT